MAENKDIRDELTAILSRFKTESPDGLGPHLAGPWADLSAGTWTRQDLPDRRQVYEHITYLRHDLENLLTLCHRLDQTVTATGREHDWSYFAYSALDLENFFTQFRSLFDHIPPLLEPFASKTGKIPSKSFRKLRTAANAEAKNIGRYIDPRIEKLIHDLTWFDDMRTVRDNVMHSGSRAVVFAAQEEGVLFSVAGWNRRRSDLEFRADRESILFNENEVFYFDAFASLYVGRLLAFLDGLAEWLGSYLTFTPESARNHHPGVATLRRWTETTLARIGGKETSVADDAVSLTD